jgi:tRNA(adenine34) deaminase
MHITKKNIFFIKKLYNYIKKNSLLEIPIAALIIHNNIILCIKKNTNESNTPLNHAEILAINEVINHHPKINLSECILITSLEPCLMCTGAAIHANIKIIYYLCKSPEGGIQTKFNITCITNISIIPILIYENKIKKLIQLFFRYKRK